MRRTELLSIYECVHYACQVLSSLCVLNFLVWQYMMWSTWCDSTWCEVHDVAVHDETLNYWHKHKQWLPGIAHVGIFQYHYKKGSLVMLKQDRVSPLRQDNLTSFTSGWHSGDAGVCPWVVHGATELRVFTVVASGMAVGCCELRLRWKPRYRLVCNRFPDPGGG